MEVSFGYNHYLKTYWLQGKLPTVKKGMYGGVLKKKGRQKATLEHIKCHSQGGLTSLGNLGIATWENNNKRGCKPLQDVFSYEAMSTYLKQFKDVIVDKLDGNKYIKLILNTLKELGIDIGRIKI
jgi:hypothetical protein